jgi:segregation and condensation protein B
MTPCLLFESKLFLHHIATLQSWSSMEKNTDLEETVDKKEVMLMEAALYVAGRPLGLRTLGRVLGIRSKERVLKTARYLVEKYSNYNCAIELLELKEQRFVMQLKAGYSKKVRKLSMQSMLTSGPLRTLSYVAYYQPVLQTAVIEARGSHAYRHLKLLEEQNLITKRGAGRTSIIRTTPFFADYFGLSHDPGALKRQIKSLFKPV